MSVTAAEGFVAAGLACRDQGRRCRDIGAARDR